MPRLLPFYLLLAFAAPAFAKPFPLPCSELWGAVTDTLSNPGNYEIIAVDDPQMKASFVVVGSLYRAVNSLFLKTKGDGCELEIRMGFTGNDDEGALRSRVKREITKRMAAKPVSPQPAAGAGG